MARTPDPRLKRAFGRGVKSVVLDSPKRGLNHFKLEACKFDEDQYEYLDEDDAEVVEDDEDYDEGEAEEEPGEHEWEVVEDEQWEDNNQEDGDGYGLEDD